eukprot:CAMPEP_0201517650 /NCGR_PEP_ID=MMETSP0161_2-20130828/8708_1 /ASSEMBLY_ACC=CAM_ASM_000251 /TAXON_ID=180227 /ORGANISM="Neoparamoeba aestuarina, Strain SoJaBio B1-5/56/2" /LENGTH=82 /DNA_ID=CAMNT_0047915211 /DNA_START=128 /DNA_END=373 /DNA_ORIENTATION=-
MSNNNKNNNNNNGGGKTYTPGRSGRYGPMIQPTNKTQKIRTQMSSNIPKPVTLPSIRSETTDDDNNNSTHHPHQQQHHHQQQ